MRQKQVDKAPRNHKTTGDYQKKGLILVNTGAGKGKTTAAFGTALRALGCGWKVGMVQFIKGKWKTGEVEAAKKFGDQFQIFTIGDGFTWDTQNFEKDVQTAEKAWEKVLVLVVTEADVQKVARELFQNKKMTLAVIGPYKSEEKFKALL